MKVNECSVRLTTSPEYDNIAHVRGYGGIGRRARFRF